MSVLVLSEAQVASVTSTLSASLLTLMIGRTMHAITADAKLGPKETDVVPPIQNPLRIATESGAHKTLYMPSRLTTSQDISLTAVKIVSVPKPSTSIPGLPATTLLFDEQTGKCSAMVNAGELTGIRTAAGSALASQLLAKPDSTYLLCFGTGTQAYHHARLILELFPTIKEAAFVVRAVTHRGTALAHKIKEKFPLVDVSLNLVSDTRGLVKKADIICLCVPSTQPVFDAKDLKIGVHINAIGSYTPSMMEFSPSLISPSESDSIKIPTILVDSRNACLAEAGELIASGILPTSLLELGDVVDIAGARVPNFDEFGLRKEGRSLFKSVGIGGMDVAITSLVAQMATTMGIGTRVEF
ncbi:hypothetical protein P7C70_g2899, partial [Phenoliferia sp. Uapishka_3]